MDSILVAIPTIIEFSINPIKRHISYPFKYKINVKNLEEQVEALKKARERMQHKVNEEKRSGKLIEKDVEEWLVEVDAMVVRESEELVLASVKAQKKCFFGFCPNLKTRYQVSRKAEKKAGEIVKVRQKREEFSANISYGAPPPWIGAFSTGDYKALESRMSISKGIMIALHAADVGMVGVFGAGGVGKTTLAREVARQVMEEKLFDEVAVATVTKDVNVKSIQEQIADLLGFEFEEDSLVGRASRLFGRLKNKDKAKNNKKILIVLDDLWEKLDLEAIGIPSDKQHYGGCKILLTSRDLDILKDGMNCKYNFEVGSLPENDAWGLFQMMAENNFENDDRHSTAMEVAKMCAGLPVAIVTVARTLRNKTLREWKSALQRLKHPSFEDPSKMHRTIYSTIGFSYDNLETVEHKSTFLLCSQMGYHATTKDLLKYGIGLTLFQDVFTLEEAQDRVFSLVQKLKAVCLLLEGKTSEEVVVHDLVRDVGRWIAAREQSVLVVNDENKMKELVDHEDKLKTYSAIWLNCNIEKLPEEMQCPRLSLFHIDNMNLTLQIPDKLLIGMRQLTALSFTGLSFPSLPSSFDSLENLKTLCIHKSPELGDVSMVGKLRRMEVLSFVKSKIKHLPIEIGQLSKLKLLDLSDCNKLVVIPPNVLTKLSQLEGLHMGNSFANWGSDGGDTASVSELKPLTSLTSLDISIRDAHSISSREIFSNNLCTYRIFIGTVWNWDDKDNKSSKTLKLQFTNTDVDMEDLGVMGLLKETEELCFHGLRGVKNFQCVLYTDMGFPKLKNLVIHDSPEIQCVLDHSTEVADPFPMLESLDLRRLGSLENICGQCRLIKMQPFRKLRCIKVSGCDSLKYLFSFYVAQGLSQLLEIEVQYCRNLEEIVAEGDEEEGLKESEGTNKNNIVFTQLQSLSLINLDKLKNFCSKEKTSLQEAEKTLIPVFGEQNLLPSIGISFQKLIQLEVCGCYGLKCLFPASFVKCLGELKKLKIIDCNSMEEVAVVGTEEQIEFPLLKELTIWGCPALKAFTTSSCEKEILEDKNANQRRPLFDETVAFPNLVKLDILGIGKIGKIWHRQLAPDSFCKLREVRVQGCDRVVNIFSSNLMGIGGFQKLEKLDVAYCESLEEIFEVEGWSESNHTQTVVPISFQLKVLDLHYLSRLRHIWSFCCKDPALGPGFDVYDFSNIRSVNVQSCEVLKSVFPCSIATHLPKLEELCITNTGVEEIVAKEEEINNAAAPCFRFPELTALKLKAPKLRSWYQGMHTSAFPKLKVLYVQTEAKSFAAQVDNIQIPQPLLSFQKVTSNLEELRLDGSKSSHPMMWQEYFQPNLFPRLKLLNLQDFKHVWAGLPIGFLQELHSLEKLSVENCGFEKLFICYDCDEVLTGITLIPPPLKHLHIYRLDELQHLWDWEQKDSHVYVSLLRDLETLRVEFCQSLVDLTPLSSAPSFQNLTSLLVRDCRSLLSLFTNLESAKSLTDDQEVEEEITTTTTFPNLQHLELVRLENLISFCSANYNLNFPSLDQVVVEKCPKMRVFSPPGLQLSTPKLQQVYLDRDMKKKHWEGNLNNTINHLYTQMVGWGRKCHLKLSDFPELKQTWHGPTFPVKLLRELWTLVVDNCPLFSNAVPSNWIPFLGSLWKLHVRNCDSIEGVFILKRLNDDDHDRLLPRLLELSLSDLPRLMRICNMNPQGILEFRCLRRLIIHNCSSLRNVFTPSMALDLVLLDKIEIRNCTLLEKIVTKEEEKEGEAATIFMKEDEVIFPQLRYIILESLPNLVSINSGSGILEFSSLQEINIQNCPNMKPFISSILRGQVLQNTKIALSSLAKLGLDWNDTLKEMGSGDQVQSDFFRQLEVLEITNVHNDYDGFPSHFLERFPNLKSFKISNALFKEMLIYEGANDEDTNEGALKGLRELTLSDLPKLMHLANQGSKWCSIFRSLKTLKVSDCGILGPLVPPTTSFQCLTTLEVSKCHELLHLITSSVAKSLVMLSSMRITECKMIEQVAVKEENEAEHEVTFDNLEHLELHSLPNFVGFSLWNCAFTFPTLKEVRARECPKMKIFSQGDVRTPKLRRVLLEEGTDKWCWKGSLNATIQKLFMDQVVLKSNQPSLPKQQLDIDVGQPGTMNDQRENPTQNQNSLTAKDIETDTGLQEQKGPQAIDESITVPAAAVVPEVSSSASPTKTPGETLIDAETCIPPQTKEDQVMTSSTIENSSNILVSLAATSEPERTSHFEGDFMSLFFNVEQLLNPSPASSSSSQPDTQAHTRHPRQSTGERFKSSVTLMKEILAKELSDVATSDDDLFLLSTLKTLKNCPSLAPEQLAIIDVYMKNFDCLVTNYPFHKQQLDRSFMEHENKGILDLKMEYEELTSEANTLRAKKEALKKELLETEDREEKVLAKRGSLYGQLLSRKGKLETRMDTIQEAARLQKEAGDRVSNAKHHWAKMRSLFP